jgi:hypothetical protein
MGVSPTARSAIDVMLTLTVSNDKQLLHGTLVIGVSIDDPMPNRSDVSFGPTARIGSRPEADLAD